MKLCHFNVGLTEPLFLIAGPCVIESESMTIDVAGQLKEMTDKLGIPFIFKSSFDKANRSSNKTFRGFGVEEGLRILQEVKSQIGVPVLTDIHTAEQVEEVASVVDVLQTPAFLCRQTDFINAVAKSGKPVNIKKGQFLAPQDMRQVVNKAKEANGGLDNIMVLPILCNNRGGKAIGVVGKANLCLCLQEQRFPAGYPEFLWRHIPSRAKLCLTVQMQFLWIK
jgi:2-dehydro-3-deoxyphosphooctonate aldolase (KDO 8-P synthase)